MEIIGSKVKSKFTGAEGVITTVIGKKLKVSFCNGGEIVVDADCLIMDNELENAIKELLTATRSSGSRTSKKIGNYNGGRIKKISNNDDVSFSVEYDVINACFGTEYNGYMSVSWSLNETYKVWFPKLIPDMTYPPAAKGWKNVLSDDGMLLISRDESDEPSTNANKDEKVLVFAKDYNGPYRFRGVFVYELDGSDQRNSVFRKIADTAELVGNPVSDIRIY